MASSYRDEEAAIESPGRSKDNNDSEDREDFELSKVETSGGKYVHLGGKTYLRDDLQAAFGGYFNPGLHAAPRLRLGSSSPMGLFAFATTTLILSLINAGARGVHTNSIVLGSALFYGGFVQIVAGVWELISENTYGATVFTAYGGFWMSFSVITMNGFNIASAYSKESEFANALGLFMLVWAIVTFFFILGTLRSTVAMFSLFLFLTMTFILLAAGEFTSTYANLGGVSSNLTTAGGVFGCLTAFVAYYNAMAGLLTAENSWFRMHPIYMPGAIRPEKLKSA